MERSACRSRRQIDSCRRPAPRLRVRPARRIPDASAAPPARRERRGRVWVRRFLLRSRREGDARHRRSQFRRDWSGKSGADGRFRRCRLSTQPRGKVPRRRLSGRVRQALPANSFRPPRAAVWTQKDAPSSRARLESRDRTSYHPYRCGWRCSRDRVAAVGSKPAPSSLLLQAAAVHRQAAFLPSSQWFRSVHGALIWPIWLIEPGRRQIEGVAHFDRCRAPLRPDP